MLSIFATFCNFCCLYLLNLMNFLLTFFFFAYTFWWVDMASHGDFGIRGINGEHTSSLSKSRLLWSSSTKQSGVMWFIV